MERRRQHLRGRRLRLRRLLPDCHQHLLRPQKVETAAQYGIFSSNWCGGSWDHTYASNFNDSGYYIGACQQKCNQTIDHAHAQFNALGYSGSNSGGQIVIKNSEFDNNKDGFDTNSQNGDDPSPQNGACPSNGDQPDHPHAFVLGVHEQLRARQQQPQRAVLGPRRGRSGRNRACRCRAGATTRSMHNRFERNGRLGDDPRPVPGQRRPVPGRDGLSLPANVPAGSRNGATRARQLVRGNGFFGNPTNGDLAQFTGSVVPRTAMPAIPLLPRQASDDLAGGAAAVLSGRAARSSTREPQR